MKRKIIKRVIIAIPILLLVKCSGVVDDILGGQFPLNIRNDGNNIKIHINDIKDSEVRVEATYLSKKCTTAHLNAAYTKISYSSDEESVNIDNIENSNGITVFTVPINGGGWCNWALTTALIELTPRENKGVVSTRIPIDVVNTDINHISHDILLAPIIIKEYNGKDEFYYRASKIGDNKISNNKNGEIYINATLKNELLTYSLMDKGVVIFPNGVKKSLSSHSDLISPDFNEIVENSTLKDKIITEKEQ
ncbi:Uncharacterised protein [Morganella morganii]|uniref:hypothetical protein n=1 Tax=Morganella morganii TaxID=582 RepID=UPI000D8C206B|nr:hypothetical protein [Morganella morganii]SPX81858.1 Uncharacterised protein [Morganella morganii]